MVLPRLLASKPLGARNMAFLGNTGHLTGVKVSSYSKRLYGKLCLATMTDVEFLRTLRRDVQAYCAAIDSYCSSSADREDRQRASDEFYKCRERLTESLHRANLIAKRTKLKISFEKLLSFQVYDRDYIDSEEVIDKIGLIIGRCEDAQVDNATTPVNTEGETQLVSTSKLGQWFVEAAGKHAVSLIVGGLLALIALLWRYFFST